jgi:hypothetical protein
MMRRHSCETVRSATWWVQLDLVSTLPNGHWRPGGRSWSVMVTLCVALSH